MIGSGVGSFAGGYISESLGGSYELGSAIGSMAGGIIGGKIQSKMAARAAKPWGSQLDLNGPSYQEGVDPRSVAFKPRKNLKKLDPTRLAKVESLVQSGKVRDTVEILRNGQVQQGHHRLANAIKHKRTIDVIIKWFLGEWLIW